MTQAYPTGPGFPNRWDTFGNVEDSLGTSSYTQSTTGRNLAFAGAGLQTLGALGQTLYGGRQQRRQAEENRRAIGKANLISILSGGNVTPNPNVVQSSGANTSKFLSNVGTGLTSLGQQLQGFRESEIKLKLAEEAALAQAKAERRNDNEHRARMFEIEVTQAKRAGEMEALKSVQAIQQEIDLSDPEIRAEWEELKVNEPPHYRSTRHEVTADLMTPLILGGIAKVESGGEKDPYTAKGQVMETGQYKGDRAYGKYQIMGGNINPFLREMGLTQEITPEMFLSDPGLQEAVARHQFDKHIKHGLENGKTPEDIIKSSASIWFSGGYDNYKDPANAELSDGNKLLTDYVNDVYGNVEHDLQSIGPAKEYNEDWAELELEKIQMLEETTSENIKEMMKTNNVSLGFQDYFENGMRSVLGTKVKEWEEEQFNILGQWHTHRMQEDTLRERVRARLGSERESRLKQANLVGADYREMEELATTRTLELNEEFIDLPQVKSYANYTDQYSKLMTTLSDLRNYIQAHELKGLSRDDILNSMNQGAHHIAVVNHFQRLIDEATVREGDIELWQQKGAGTAARFKVAIDNTFGGKMFTEDTLESMAKIAEAMDKGLRSKLARKAISFGNSKAMSAYLDPGAGASESRKQQVQARRDIFARTVALSALEYLDFDQASVGGILDGKDVNDIEEARRRYPDLFGKGTISWDRTEEEKAAIQVEYDKISKNELDLEQFGATIGTLKRELGIDQELPPGHGVLKLSREQLDETLPMLDVEQIPATSQEERKFKALMQARKSGRKLTPAEEEEFWELHRTLSKQDVLGLLRGTPSTQQYTTMTGGQYTTGNAPASPASALASR